ncbi:MAG: HAD family hydrolase [Candidatus Onthomonas sp.]
MGYTAVIFDMDGTVLNTLEDLADAVNAMRRHEGLEALSVDQVRQSVGNGVAVLMEKTLPGGRAYPRYEEATAFYRAYYESHCRIKTAPYPGILPLLDELKGRGISLAVVSNKQDAAVKPLSRAFFGERMAVSMGEAPGLRRKPYPDMVWAAIEQLGKNREECLYVGDSEVDVATARNAGLDCCSVTWGFRDREMLRSLEPDYLIDCPEELLNLL